MINSISQKYYVYEWFIKNTGEVFYVGKGCGERYKTRKRENVFFMRIMSTHECDVRKVVIGLTEKRAFEEEIKLISVYRKNPNYRLTNVTEGGSQPPTYYGEESFSKLPEVRKKISVSTILRWQDDEFKKQRSLSFKAFYNSEHGKEVASKRTSRNWEKAEFRNKIVTRMTATTNTEEYKIAHSIRMKEAYSTQEVRDKVTGANNGASRRIQQFTIEDNFVAEYETLMQADRATGIRFKNITKALNGHRKTAGGFKWKFSDNKIISYKKRTPYQSGIKRDRKPIIQYDLTGKYIKEYSSVTAATLENNFNNHTNIIANLKGRGKSAYGFVWKYKE